MGVSAKYDLDKIRHGDDSVFEQLFTDYFERMCCFARAYVGDWEVARELAQETFVKFWEIRETLAEDSDVEALLFTITRNHALNYLKHLSVRARYSRLSERQYLESQLNLMSLEDLQIDQIFNKELQNRLNQAISDLPDRCREVFLMSRNFDMSYSEIAQQLQISVRTVENHISEALKKLRHHLQVE